jgi:very-short-patch-repair endonuclease
MARLLRGTGLPAPIVELTTGPGGRYRLDFAWPEVMLSIEVKGFGPHSALHAFESDMVRGNAVRRKGWLHLEYSWRHVVAMRTLVAAEIVDAYNRQAVLRSIVRRNAG